MVQASRAFCLALMVVAAAGRAAVSDVVNLAPSKDNTLIQTSDPDGQLSNALGDIFVGRTNQAIALSIRRGLVAFDIAGSVPAGSTITEVTLSVRDVVGSNGDHAVALHRLLQDWGEGTSFQNGGSGVAATDGDATWLYTHFNASTPAASPSWTTPGGSYDPAASASTVILDDLGAGQVFNWSSSSNPQMLVDVQGWLDNPAANCGWLLLGNESQGLTVKRFNSGESTTAPNVPPVLSVRYLIPEPSALALAAVAASGLALVSWMRRTKQG
jgi:hypothetical protein